MNPLTTLVRSLGNDGALANAQAALDARRHEDWLIQGLARRLDSLDQLTPAPDRQIAATLATSVA